MPTILMLSSSLSSGDLFKLEIHLRHLPRTICPNGPTRRFGQGRRRCSQIWDLIVSLRSSLPPKRFEAPGLLLGLGHWILSWSANSPAPPRCERRPPPFLQHSSSSRSSSISSYSLLPRSAKGCAWPLSSRKTKIHCPCLIHFTYCSYYLL